MAEEVKLTDDGYSLDKPRRVSSTFYLPADVPVKGKVWDNMKFRERIKVWVKDNAMLGQINPLTIYVYVLLKLISYVLLYRYLVMDIT